MKTHISSGLDAQIRGSLRFIGFVFLVISFIFASFFMILLGERLHSCGIRYFHFLLIKLLGFRVRVKGEISTQSPVLFVSNHSSYLDIPILGSLILGRFVAKSEVAGWPLIGFLARIQNTLFVERRPIKARGQRDVLQNELQQGHNLILFPEGTSSDGHRTLPFKSSLFSVVEKGAQEGIAIAVQPVSIVCTKVAGLPMGRLWRPYYAWYGDMTLVKHVWEVFKIGSFTIDVVFHPVVTFDKMETRKELACFCENLVGQGVTQSVAGRA